MKRFVFLLVFACAAASGAALYAADKLPGQIGVKLDRGVFALYETVDGDCLVGKL